MTSATTMSEIPAMTAMRITHQTTCEAHPVPSLVATCQNVHFTHREFHTSIQSSTAAIGTQPPFKSTRFNSHDTHTLELLHDPHPSIAVPHAVHTCPAMKYPISHDPHPNAVFVAQLVSVSYDSHARDVVSSQWSAAHWRHPRFEHVTQLSEHSTHAVSFR